MLLVAVMASPFGVGYSWRRGVEESARIVVQSVSRNMGGRNAGLNTRGRQNKVAKTWWF